METFVRSVLTTETGNGFLQQGLESEPVQLGLNVCVLCIIPRRQKYKPPN